MGNVEELKDIHKGGGGSFEEHLDQVPATGDRVGPTAAMSEDLGTFSSVIERAS